MKSHTENETAPRPRTVGLLIAAVLTAAAAGCGPMEAAPSSSSFAQSASAVSVRELTLSSPSVRAGESVTGTVRLTGAAQGSSGGVVVYVGFRSTLLAGPRFVRVPNGASSATFTLHSNPFLSSGANASISATTSSPQPSSFVAQGLSILPPANAPAGSAPRVSSVAIAPADVASGETATGTVTLDVPAPDGGAAVQLSNSADFFDLDADVPPVVTVPAGATSASFAVRTHLAGGATLVQEIVVANYFGGTFQGAYLAIRAATP